MEALGSTNRAEGQGSAPADDEDDDDEEDDSGGRGRGRRLFVSAKQAKSGPEYRSDTDDETKYLTHDNRDFLFVAGKEARRRYLLRLWRKAYWRALGCSAITEQFMFIQTKIAYFGKQMLPFRKRTRRSHRQQNLPFVINPESKLKLFWDFLLLCHIFQTVLWSPY